MRHGRLLVLILAALIALRCARPYAGGWNDGSRLATVESLVDRHTLAIDESIFVEPVRAAQPALPYAPNEQGLLKTGTGDKLLIGGHYYSDKSPVPALLLAVVYQGLQTTTGLVARKHADRFCWAMTVASSGLAYVVACVGMFQLACILGLAERLRWGLTGSFALGTVALAYTEHVNNHLMLLGVTTALLLAMVQLSQEAHPSLLRLLAIGALAGFGYTIDLGIGPMLLACSLAWVACRFRRLRILVLVGLAAAPLVALHHVVNYQTGGTFKPANAVADYLQWPGSSFTPQNMTGSWQHASLGKFLLYAGALLAGKRGFLGHNLPLFLAVAAAVGLVRRCREERVEIGFALAFSCASWLVYAVNSNNYSGMCCSIRWFVPLLAPGFYLIGLALRDEAKWERPFWILSGWGLVLSGLMAWYGPWIKHMVPAYWPIQGAALVSLLVARRKRALSAIRPPILTENRKVA